MIRVLLPTSPWFRNDLQRGIHDILAPSGLRYETATFNSERLRRLLSEDAVKGGIFYMANSVDARLAARSGIPIVNLSGVQSQSPVPRVRFDDQAAGVLAGKELQRFSVPELACVGVGAHTHSCERISGFLSTLPHPGDVSIVWMDQQMDGTAGWRSAEDCVAWLRQRKPPFALYLTDTAGNWAYHLKDAGLRYPEDVLVLQTGGPTQPDALDPLPVSTVALNAREVGRTAARTLLDLLDGKQVPRDQRIPPKVILSRMSTSFIPSSDEVVADAVRYIHNHLGTITSVDHILEHVPICRSLLERRFKAAMGTGIGAFIRKERVREARRLLIETDWPVEQIAEQTGYREHTRLYEAFKREYNLTPRRFRMML